MLKGGGGLTPSPPLRMPLLVFVKSIKLHLRFEFNHQSKKICRTTRPVRLGERGDFIDKVRGKGAISVIFGSQVLLRIHYCM